MSRDTVRLLGGVGAIVLVLAVVLVLEAVTGSTVAAVAGAVVAVLVLFISADPPFGPRRGGGTARSRRRRA